ARWLHVRELAGLAARGGARPRAPRRSVDAVRGDGGRWPADRILRPARGRLEADRGGGGPVGVPLGALLRSRALAVREGLRVQGPCALTSRSSSSGSSRAARPRPSRSRTAPYS